MGEVDRDYEVFWEKLVIVLVVWYGNAYGGFHGLMVSSMFVMMQRYRVLYSYALFPDED